MPIGRNEENSKDNPTRRTILKASLLAAGAGILALGKSSRRASAQVPPDCPSAPASWNLEMFRDPLPIPEVLASRGRNRGMPTYQLTANQFTHSFHSALPPSQVWGFNGRIPGPTIEAWRGMPIQVQVTNNLQSYILCPDEQVHGAWPVPYLTVHGHGLLDNHNSDGFPEDRFPPGVTW